ncbi:MAG: cation:proton antiporter [Holophagaceae bacterium]|nr:cation:proton antiporter [Holophagaceae bacterium]
MHNIPHLVIDLALALSTAAVTTLVCRRFNLPVVVGYLLAGLLVGPLSPFPIASLENIEVMSELGIILIMFGIGLEFNVKKITQAGPAALLMASLQAGFVILAGITASRVLGWNSSEGIFVGCAMVATSTVVIVKLFEERNPSKVLRETIFSVTIIHDLIAILLMTGLSTYAKVGTKGLQASYIGWTLLQLGLFLVVVIGVGRFFIPQFLRKLADKEKPENLVIASTGFCFAIAILAGLSGFSLALGAFVAGMLAAESGREQKIEKLIIPMRDVFTSLFFVAIGMMLVPETIIDNIGIILLFVFLVIIANLISLTLGGIFTGLPFKTSFETGIALGQFGEFAFVMMNIGIAAGLVRQELFSVVVSVAVLTAFTSSYLFRHASSMSDILESRLPERLRASIALYQVWAGSLRNRRIQNKERNALIKPIVFMLLDSFALVGLFAGHDYLIHKPPVWLEGIEGWNNALAQTSLSVLLGICAAFAVVGIFKWGRVLARQLASMTPNPEVSGVGRGGRHLLAGGLRFAILVIVSLPLITILQTYVHIGLLFFIALIVFVLVSIVQIFRVRKHSHEIPIGMEWVVNKLVEPTHGHQKDITISERTGTLRICLIGLDSPSLGRTIKELDLPGQTGITLVALFRDGNMPTILSPTLVLQDKDRLVLSGPERALRDAEAILNG